MFIKVLFHGALKRICPDEYKVDVNTPAEAIRAVTNQFRDKLIRKDGQRFVCSVKECPRDVDLNSSVRGDEINIYPAFCASGGGGKNTGSWVTIAIGAVLIAAAILAGPGGWAIAGVGAGWISGSTAATMCIMGAGMMLSGMTNLLFSSKLPTANDSNNPDSSKAFGNSGNTTKIGTRIPIGYGKYKISGHYLSINTIATDLFGDTVKIASALGHKVYIDKFGVE